MSIRSGPEMADFRPKLRFRAADVTMRRRFPGPGGPGIGGWIVARRPIRAYLDGIAAPVPRGTAEAATVAVDTAPASIRQVRFNEEADRLFRPFTEADRRAPAMVQP